MPLSAIRPFRHHHLRIARLPPFETCRPRFVCPPLLRPCTCRMGFEAVLHEPRPPFSLSGTIRIFQLSNLVGHFQMGELFLGLLLLLRSENPYLFRRWVTADEASECITALILAMQTRQQAIGQLGVVPEIAQQPAGAAVGGQLDLMA